jgi:hypothetical protein
MQTGLDEKIDMVQLVNVLAGRYSCDMDKLEGTEHALGN